MKLRVRGPSKSVVFAVLMVAAAVASLLPASWTSWARGMVQILGLPQRALSSAARGVREVVLEPGGPALSRAEAERLQEENAELHRLLAAQQAWLEGLERRYDEVCGIRRQLGDVGTALLVAPALGYDSSPVRDTLLIGKGEVDGVQEGQWVAAALPATEVQADQSGRQLLMRQWLIGRVSEVQPYTARVRLVSDPKFGASQAGEPVCLARRLADGRWQPTPAKYVLSGRGSGRGVISRADADYWSLGYELVLATPGPDLPVTLSIGRIVGSRRLEESALHFDLDVQPLGDVRALSWVYVILTGR